MLREAGDQGRHHYLLWGALPASSKSGARTQRNVGWPTRDFMIGFHREEIRLDFRLCFDSLNRTFIAFDTSTSESSYAS
jgi:hypothetical protein